MSRDVLIAPNEKSKRGNSKYRKGKKIVASQASPFKNEWLIIVTFSPLNLSEQIITKLKFKANKTA